MKFRLPLALTQALIIAPFVVPATATEVGGDYYQLISGWGKSDKFELISDMEISSEIGEYRLFDQPGNTRYETALTVSNGKTVTVNGAKQDGGRYSIQNADIITRTSVIARGFIVGGGSLVLENLQFSRLIESNEWGLDPDWVPTPKQSRSQEVVTAIVAFHSCGAAVFSNSDTSAITLNNCSFDKNSIAWAVPFYTDVRLPAEAIKTDVVQVSGGAVGGKGLFSISESTFSNNYTQAIFYADTIFATSSGGAISAQKLSVDNSEFSSNRALASETEYSGNNHAAETTITTKGGAISAENTQGTVTISYSRFMVNSALSEGITSEDPSITHASTAIAAGGAIFVSGNHPVLIDYSTFAGNYAQAMGVEGYIVGNESKVVKATATGGALSISGEGQVSISHSTFSSNRALATGIESFAKGGAIYFTSSQGINNQVLSLNDCSFENNFVKSTGTNHGGAIYISTPSDSSGAPTSSIFTDCSFMGNAVSAGLASKGGAIYIEGSSNLALISAQKDVIFRGNFIDANKGDLKRGNAIHFETGYSSPSSQIVMVDFKALNTYDSAQPAAGSSVLFYDSVDFAPQSDTSFHFNRTENGTNYLGRITFSGIDYQGEDEPSVASRTSTGNENTHFNQWNGLVQITDKAIVGAKEAKKYDPGQYEIGAESFTQHDGTLEISREGHLLVNTFTLTKGTVDIGTNGHMTVDSFSTNGASWKDTTLDLSDNTGHLTANTIDLTKGARLELGIQPGISGADTPCGWLVTANSIVLGGTMGIVDRPLDYYMNSKFQTSQDFLVFKGVNADASYTDMAGDSAPVISETHNSSNVSDYYSGTWSYKVVTNSDGTKDLYAVWTRGDEPPGEVTPELSGGNVENSIWSTDSNMKSLSSLATGQLGIDRYRLKNCSNYWVTTIGDFDMHRTTGNRPGYDYDGFGYAVGGDARFCPDNFVLGMAFGNIYGKNNSREFASRINQTSYISLLYWGWLKEFDKKNSLNLTGTASYGITNNRMKTYYSDGMRSTGKWDNQAMRFTIKAEWLRDMGNNWTLAPFVGAEYDDVTAESFTESGSRPRFFEKGKMRNLAIPVGVSLSKQHMLNNGKVWINSVSAAYLPDVYRKNPSATTTRRTEDAISWTARGTAAARNAGRVEYSSRLIFNPTWSTFAGYTVEFRSNKLYQQASLGVSASF